jgi:hypothetical protein
MSGIQLSSELVENVISVLVEHDETAQNDLILMQYMSAVTAYVLAHQTDPAIDKNALLGDLTTFMRQVLSQVEQDLNAKAPQHSSKEGAFGIWKPDQK